MLINTTKEINGTKYSFDKNGVGSIWTKFKVTLDKELPYTYEHRNIKTGEMDKAWTLKRFKYDYKENYATKNNDLTITFDMELLYSKELRQYSRYTNIYYVISLIDESGQPATMEPIESLIMTKKTADRLTGYSFNLYKEGEETSFTVSLRDIKDGNYILKFDGDE